MAPTVERFTARILAALSPEEILEIAARGCHESAAIRRDVDAELAIRTPVPDWAISQVLRSPDLVPQIFASLEVEDHAAAVVCKAWGAGWKVRMRRTLRPAPCPTIPLFKEEDMSLAVLPGGKRFAISDFSPEQVLIVDKDMKLQRTLGNATPGVTFHNMHACSLAASDDGLYVAESSNNSNPARLRRFELDTFAVAAEYTNNHYDLLKLALAPGGVLFVLAETYDDEAVAAEDWDNSTFHEVLALDARSLAVRFKVGEDVFGTRYLGLLAVGDDEVYVGVDRSIHVLSLAGKPLRVISSQPGGWRIPGELCCVADRLYLFESHEYPQHGDDDDELIRARRLTFRRIFVLTPEGRTLQVYYSPRPLEEKVALDFLCHLDGKLILTDIGDHGRREVLALQGL